MDQGFASAPQQVQGPEAPGRMASSPCQGLQSQTSSNILSGGSQSHTPSFEPSLTGWTREMIVQCRLSFLYGVLIWGASYLSKGHGCCVQVMHESNAAPGVQKALEKLGFAFVEQDLLPHLLGSVSLLSYTAPNFSHDCADVADSYFMSSCLEPCDYPEMFCSTNW